MGSFIPLNLDRSCSQSVNSSVLCNYEDEFEIFRNEIAKNSSLTVSKFCSSRKIPYEGFRSYINRNGINIQSLRMNSSNKQATISKEDLLHGVAIKLPNEVEVTFTSVLPSQLSNILKLL